VTDLRTRLQKLLDADYALERELGGGGMSRVFVATERKLGRRVVIKVMTPELAATLSTSRFQREIQVAASLQQANIVPVLSAGEVEGMPWYTMPYVEGESLRTRLARGTLSEREALSVLRDVARALVYAHERGIVHRDIKPDNVLLSGESAVVTDFGIAKAITAARTQAGAQATGITQVGTSIGTPAYMAPEQAAGDPATDHRADIYAFGCMAFELMTGRPPFVETAPHKLLAAHLSTPAPKLRDALGSANSALDTLIASSLEKQPGDRPQTARDVLAQLDVALSTSGGGTASIALAQQMSLPKAIGIWAGSFAAIWILARAAVVGIGLPEWAVPLALGVAALGLPAVVATWYVQRVARKALLTTPQHTPGGTQVHTTMATMALKAAPHVSWRRTWRAGAWGAAAVAVALAVVMILRQFGIGPAASLLNAGTIGKDSRVLIAQFTSSTTDTSLGSVVAAAMRTSLQQSSAVQLFGAGDVAAALTRMKMDASAALDDRTAQMVALREGIPLIVTGSVSPVGAGYMVTANLVRADSGIALFTVQQGASGAGDILQAVDKVARGMRSRIGESLRSIARAPSLERATTSSLAALREYSRALEAGDLRGDWVQGIARLRAALAEDSTFAMAWRKLAVYSFNNGAPRSVIAAANAAAYRFRERLPDIERADVEVYYHRERSTRRGLELYRENPNLSQNNRAIGHNAFGEYAEAESVLVAEIRKQEGLGKKPIVQLYTNLIVAQLGLARVADAQRTLEIVRREFPGSFSHQRMERWMASRVGPDSVAKLAADHARRSRIAANRAEAARVAANAALVRGQLRAAEQLGRAATFVEDSANFNADPLTNTALFTAAMAVLRNTQGDGLRRLDSLASAAGASKLPVMDRPDLAIAIAYALLGQPAKARTILTEFERVATSDDRLIRWADLQAARGEIALAEGRTAEAITAFRAATFSDTGQVEPIGWGGTHLRLARAFDRANQPDSALAHLEQFETPGVRAASLQFVPVALPIAARRRGELYEQKGDVANALKSYEEFVKLWNDADADLQPQVADVKARIARLRAKEATKR
jgi:tRNA A-37 threonylcarbamoyl transferase component Bud32/tetratricopeptide (TPR) repeat protein